MIIGIAGKIGSGKSTIAKILKAKGFQEQTYADKLKEIAIKVFDLSYDQVYTQKGKKRSFTKWYIPWRRSLTNAEIIKIYQELRWSCVSGKLIPETTFFNQMEIFKEKTFKNPREIIQWLGTEVLRDIVNKNFHIEELFANLDLSEDTVISDCRFPNERAIIKKNGGINVLIKRKATDKKSGEHESENSLGEDSEYDYILENNGSIKNLEKNVERMLLDF